MFDSSMVNEPSGFEPLVLLYIVIGPRYAKMCLRAVVDSEGPDLPAHLRSLNRVFAVRYRIIGYNEMRHWKANARMRLCAGVG